ncbi:ATP phosphoribosyltransferase [Raphidiopsis brookii D9]|nr:ATP phosphoribosyltransferase [Raphidiopsis brookii D9]
MLTVALPKGELLKNSIQLMQSAGLDFSAFLDAGNRQLQIYDASGKAKGLLVRAQDVPVYIEYGQAQLGIVGFDVLKRKKPQVGQLVDLKFGYCRMSVAVKSTSSYKSPLDLPAHGRVASKYVNCAREYFESLDLPVEIVPLYGSVELGPITGMSEAIVDIVSTGKTLRENGLVEIATLYESTARLIVHPLSYRLDLGGIYNLAQSVKSSVNS